MGNDYPIVLVHGFLGWGRDEVPGLLYWGGLEGDFEDSLSRAGHETFTAVVGPLSSVWDRAVELFAFIKGGTVDYGAAHSTKFKHDRFGATFDGLYPQWGTLDECGNVQKVHLIGHSMGGQASTVLTHLLNKGAVGEGDESVLFRGGHDWVASVTTMSTTHDGTSLATFVNKLPPLDQLVLAAFSSVAGVASEDTMLDFKLDHFGLERMAGERFDQYFRRIVSSPFWASRDTAFYDVSPDGAEALNQQFSAQNNTYYFTWAAEATFPVHRMGNHIPDLHHMNPIFFAGATIMGKLTRFEAGKVVIDRGWWQNDGVVNTVSMDGPKVGSSDAIVAFSGTPLQGVWNFMGVKHSWDHITCLGFREPKTDEKIGEKFLLDWAVFLKKLPR